MTVTGVVLDLDGVIVDSEHLWEEGWVACCARRGATWTGEDTAACQGMSPPEWARYIAEKLSALAGAGNPGVPAGADDPGVPADADTIQDECVDHVIAAIDAGHAPLLDGAGDLITQVSALAPLALASSAARRVIDAVLSHHEIADRFKATVSSEEVPRGKPSPDVYAEAVRRIGVLDGDGIAVEDSSNGIRAAHAAGLSVVAIPNPVYPPKADALALADHVAADHGDALDYLLTRLR
ncbi:MAG: HAD-IA family hydrolase [Micromonosporaceae bacterium]|nr:HAD-IA family hydrolase [Micromonosporaceae bacterium]